MHICIITCISLYPVISKLCNNMRSFPKVLQSELFPSSTRCPSVSNLLYKSSKRSQRSGNPNDNANSILECRLSRECQAGRTCCFDGAGTRCLAVEGEDGVRGDGGERTTERMPARQESTAAGKVVIK